MTSGGVRQGGCFPPNALKKAFTGPGQAEYTCGPPSPREITATGVVPGRVYVVSCVEIDGHRAKTKCGVVKCVKWKEGVLDRVRSVR
jgi:hypothetical protein